MKILFDINHPAHVHFFKNAMRQLQDHGHQVVVTSRVKECATDLLDELGVRHISLSSETGGGLLGLAKELLVRDARLLRVARKEKPDAMASIGGTFIAHVGFLTGIPSYVFYDTENAKLQNLITYPFAYRVIVPECYESWVPKNKKVTYAGYHELAYLRPDYFSANKDVAIANGLNPERENYFVRIVAWNANHDVGEEHWSAELLEQLIVDLSARGNVIISSESRLPERLEKYRYLGKVSQIHHVMAFCRAFIGESATMASECAVLGVPTIYAAKTGRGYMTEQEKKYGLNLNVTELTWPALQDAIEKLLVHSKDVYKQRQQVLLQNTIDVSKMIVDTVLGSDSVATMR